MKQAFNAHLKSGSFSFDKSICKTKVLSMKTTYMYLLGNPLNIKPVENFFLVCMLFTLR